MLISALYIFVYFFEMLISVLFYSGISERKTRLPAIIIIGTVLFEIGALSNIFIINTVWLNVIYSCLVNFILGAVFFTVRKLLALFYSVLLTAISTFMEMIVVFAVTAISKNSQIAYNHETSLFIAEIIISKALYFFIVVLLLRFAQKDTARVRIPFSFYIFPLITSVAVISFWYICLNQYLSLGNQIVITVVSALLCLATILIFFSFQSNTQKENKLLMLQHEQEKMQTDIRYYNILEQQNDNLRAYAHDAKNHLSAIKNLNNDPQIEVYISEMTNMLDKYCNVCRSGNHVLDVIIDKYAAECKFGEVNFSFYIVGNNISKIECYDMVAILGNLLDNAVEAAKNSEKKLVSVETGFVNNFNIISVTNSCEKDPKITRFSLPVTTKQNTLLHGFGLRSVRKTLKKYNGDIDFDYDKDKKFLTVTIMLEDKK